jgi:hypothetical protein
MNVKSLLASAAILTLSSCGYPIITKDITAITRTVKSCSYSPLWFAPFNVHYANVDSITKATGINNVASVEQKVYPFVLFTKSCIVVKGN